MPLNEMADQIVYQLRERYGDMPSWETVYDALRIGMTIHSLYSGVMESKPLHLVAKDHS